MVGMVPGTVALLGAIALLMVGMVLSAMAETVAIALLGAMVECQTTTTTYTGSRK